MTDDKTLDKAVRKQLQIEHAPHLSGRARAIKLADKDRQRAGCAAEASGGLAARRQLLLPLVLPQLGMLPKYSVVNNVDCVGSLAFASELGNQYGLWSLCASGPDPIWWTVGLSCLGLRSFSSPKTK